MNKFTLECLLVAGLASGLGGVALAQPLTFSQATARDAAAQISTKYGVNIVFKEPRDADRTVTFSLPDADADGARLQAVNALANALGADFQKTYVVSRMETGTETVVPRVDTNASITFPSLTVSAQDAVQRVAGVDSATSQIFGSVGETVTLSSTNLTATQAAREVSEQTHTRWKVFFALTPRTQGRTTGGRVIGRTASGSPIIEGPYTYYRPTPTEAPPAPAASQNSANVAANAPNGSGYGQMPYGFYSNPNNYPYGFDTYAGNNPYSQNIYAGGGFGTGLNGPVDNGSGLVFGGGGYSNPIVFGGGGF